MGEQQQMPMNQGIIGNVEQFDNQRTVFSEYKERLDFYFEANEITSETKKKAVFLTVVGSATFSLVKDLVAPSKIADKSYEGICSVLKEHFEPPPSKFVQRTKFEARFRKQHETLNQYIADLRKLSEHCDFGESLEERLCERLVRGINDQRIQRRLLSEVDLNLSKAMKIVQAMSLTTEAAKDLTPSASGGEIHQLRQHKSQFNQVAKQHSNSKCQRCGKDHKNKPCHFRNAECFLCKKVGHSGGLPFEEKPTEYETLATRTVEEPIQKEITLTE